MRLQRFTRRLGWRGEPAVGAAILGTCCRPEAASQRCRRNLPLGRAPDASRTTLIKGIPGTGKTILVRDLVQNWPLLAPAFFLAPTGSPIVDALPPGMEFARRLAHSPSDHYDVR
jgi:hypothetical protein